MASSIRSRNGQISGCLLIVKSIGFANILDVEFERKKLPMIPSFSAQAMGKMELPLTVGRAEIKSSAWDKFSLGHGESIPRT